MWQQRPNTCKQKRITSDPGKLWAFSFKVKAMQGVRIIVSIEKVETGIKCSTRSIFNQKANCVKPLKGMICLDKNNAPDLPAKENNFI